METEARASSVFELGREHEQVVFCNDPASGLRAIVAIYSTALGPGLGGTRFYPYASGVARPSSTCSTCRAGWPTRPPWRAWISAVARPSSSAIRQRDKTEQLLRAYGRFVQSLHGRYFTACDVGTFSEDMDVIARECEYVTGRTVANGGAGDSSVLTALGRLPGHAGVLRGGLGHRFVAGKARRNRRRRQGRTAPRRPSARGRRRRRRDRCVANLRSKKFWPNIHMLRQSIPRMS